MRKTVKWVTIFFVALKILTNTGCYGKNNRIRFRDKLDWMGDCG